MNEIITIQPDVTYTPAPVNFANFPKMKEQALILRDYLNTVKVDSDTIQTAKKMIAQTRKAVKGLDTDRIAIKKKILADYTVFEDQVKELKTIVDEADRMVRDQVKALEEKEREEKQKSLQEIFEKREKQYDIPYANLFGCWIKPNHLNKSMSISKCEKEMVEWLEKIQKDIDFINKKPERIDLLADYQMTFDVIESMENISRRKEAEEQIKKSVDEIETDEPAWHSISIFGTEEDLKRAKTLLASAMFDIA